MWLAIRLLLVAAGAWLRPWNCCGGEHHVFECMSPKSRHQYELIARVARGDGERGGGAALACACLCRGGWACSDRWLRRSCTQWLAPYACISTGLLCTRWQTIDPPPLMRRRCAWHALATVMHVMGACRGNRLAPDADVAPVIRWCAMLDGGRGGDWRSRMGLERQELLHLLHW